ncbi:MAG: hypothetical protein QME48_09010, partial [bacterium]|nr:hypothetical protein [bacterium]
MKNIFFKIDLHHDISKSLLRANRGNLLTSIRSLYLAQGARLKAHGFPQLSTINHKLLTFFAQCTRLKAHGFPQLSTINHKLLTFFAQGTRLNAHGFPQLSTINHKLLTFCFALL